MNENAAPPSYESLPPPFNEPMEPTQPNANPTLAEQVVYDTSFRLGKQQVENMMLHDQNKKLEHQVIHDSLTGLLTKGALIESADQRMSTARPDQIFAMYFIDLDDFKSVNDLHPEQHEAGDMLLRELATQLAVSARSQRGNPDLVARGNRKDDEDTARLGGDEFAVFAELTDDGKHLPPDMRYQTLQSRLKADMNKRIKELREQDPELAKLNFGATIGGVIRWPGDTTTAAQMVAKADKLMVANKKARKAQNGGGYR